MADLPSPSACRGCGQRGVVYEDKHGFLWCIVCERYNGTLRKPKQPSLFEPPDYPGDLLAAASL